MKCPFCGGEAQNVESNLREEPRYFVKCSLCHAVSDLFPNNQTAVAAWNKRRDRGAMNPLFKFNGTLLKAEALLESAMIKSLNPERMFTSGYTVVEQRIEDALTLLKGARQQISDLCQEEERK
jgi:Lar family restriction alleviation protein